MTTKAYVMPDTVTLVHEGALIPVTHMFDRKGRPVKLWAKADRFIAGPLPNGEWLAGECADFNASLKQ